MILKTVHHPAGMGRLMMKRSVLRLGELLIFEGRSLGKRMYCVCIRIIRWMMDIEFKV